MDDMEAMGAQGAEMPMEEPQEGQEGGYSILINVDPQGQMSVAPGPFMPEIEGEPAGTIKEALTMALSLHRAKGKPDPEADAQRGFDSAVNPQPQDDGDHEYRG